MNNVLKSNNLIQVYTDVLKLWNKKALEKLEERIRRMHHVRVQLKAQEFSTFAILLIAN